MFGVLSFRYTYMNAACSVIVLKYSCIENMNINTDTTENTSWQDVSYQLDLLTDGSEHVT